MSGFTANEKKLLRTAVEALQALLAAEVSTPAPAPAKARKTRSTKAATKAAVATAPQGPNCSSFGQGEALAATGVSPDEIMVPKGRFGREGFQTLTEARERRNVATAAREAYLAKREAGELPEKPATDEHGVTPEQRKATNKAMSEHLRSMGVVPSGQAWQAARDGERSAKVLRKLNKADGLTPPAKKGEKAPKAAKAPKADTAVAVTVELSDELKAKAASLVAAGFAEADALEIVGKLA